MEEIKNDKKTKSEQLYEKVDMLATKIEQEPNVIKRTFYAIRAKLVLAKIQRQIDIQNIKDEYSEKRMDNLIEAELDESDTTSEIISLNRRINDLKRQIGMYSEYDVNSKSFMFGQSNVERKGGVDNYIARLNQSGRPDQIEAAEKMKFVESLKKELRERQEELKGKQDILRDIDLNTKMSNKSLKTEETALVVKKKINIFSKISNFFKNVWSGIKEGREQHEDVKERRQQGMEQDDGKKLTREEALAQLEKEYLNSRESIIQEYARAEEEFKGTQAKSQADDFRAQVRKMAESSEPKVVPEVFDVPIVEESARHDESPEQESSR